jgi:NADP-dependent 3-hydroxy acid dehydrogenase YdfG
VATEIHSEGMKKLMKKVKDEEMLDAKDIAGAILFCLSQPNRSNIISMQIKPLFQNI